MVSLIFTFDLMTKPTSIFSENLRGYSRALFSTWLYHRRFNMLFDAGEGVATLLLNRVFGIHRVFLSHGHADHIAGLVNLVNIRNLGAGDQTTDLEIFYPRNNTLIELIRNYLAQTQNELSFTLRWIPMEEGQQIDLETRRGRTYLRSFRTQHSHKQLSLGFNIVELRRRLKAEYVGKTQAEINQSIWKLGKEAVAEEFEQIIFTYGGDSRPINPAHIAQTLFLCHECTYLKLDDDERNFQQHSILDEVMASASAAEVKTLLLFHLSLRYSPDEIRAAVRESIRKHRFAGKVAFLFGDRFYDPSEGEAGRKGERSTELLPLDAGCPLPEEPEDD